MTPRLKEVRVLNSEINTHYYLTMREDRVAQFYELLVENRKTQPTMSRIWPPLYMPSFDGPVVTGLSTIFTHIPLRFRVEDIIFFLCGMGNPPFHPVEIQKALEHFGQTMPLLLADGSEIQ